MESEIGKDVDVSTVFGLLIVTCPSVITESNHR